MVDNYQNSAKQHQVNTIRPSWDETWMNVAKTIAERSLCGRSRVGAVIVDERNRPVSMGYNGPPQNFNHENYWCSAWCARGNVPNVYQETGVMPDKMYSDCPSLHAEQNALITADRATFTGGTIYVNSHLCWTCTKLVGNSGLIRVVAYDDGSNRSYREFDKCYAYLIGLNIQVDVKAASLILGNWPALPIQRDNIE